MFPLHVVMWRGRRCADLRARAITRIHQPLLGQTRERLLIQSPPLILNIRPMPTTDIRPFIPIQAEPAQIGQQRRRKVWTGPIWIEVFHTQHKAAPALARIEPGQQRRPYVTEMDRAGRARREAATSLC